MKFCDFAKLMHDNYEEKANAGKFVVILIDAILDGEALEKAEPNPLYGLGKSTLEAYYSGRRLISQRKAAQIVPRLSEETFAGFVETYSMDALDHIGDKLLEFGFDVESYEVGKACANILAQMIKRRSEGLSDDVVKLDFKPYKAYLRITTEMSLIDSYSEDFGSDLDAIENEKKNDTTTEYHPKEYFSDDFVPTMSEYAQTILKECHYSELLRETVNFSQFDIMVNGEDKGTSHGKGYRSYLNTVMILMIRKYLANFAKFDPHTFIIDMPLHGFDDGVDDDMPESMRTGLYQYFMNHQDEGQLIIIENLNHIPHLDYESSGATVTTFEKVDGPGKRYGFLNDVK